MKDCEKGAMHADQDRGKSVAGVILAAGMSTRMGTAKQLLLFQGKPLLAHVLINARAAASLDPLIVVLGHQAQEIRRKIDFDADHVVIAKEYHLGQSASLKAGLCAVPESCDGVLFLLGDQPLVSAEIIDQIVKEFGRSGSDIIIPMYSGKRGNPVLIARGLFPQLFSIYGDIGARSLFQTYPERVMKIEVATEDFCFDVDTLEDYRSLCQADSQTPKLPTVKMKS
jgi:molybdenum cofactor cytidylyltransferase